MTEYHTLNVKPETYEQLAEGKPDGVTWDYYLRQLAEEE